MITNWLMCHRNDAMRKISEKQNLIFWPKFPTFPYVVTKTSLKTFYVSWFVETLRDFKKKNNVVQKR